MFESSYQRLQKVMQKFQEEETNIKERERKQEYEKEIAMEKMNYNKDCEWKGKFWNREVSQKVICQVNLLRLSCQNLG